MSQEAAQSAVNATRLETPTATSRTRQSRRLIATFSLALAAAAVGQALALGLVATADGATAPVTALQLKNGFTKTTKQKLVVDTLRSTAGSYVAFNLGVETVERRARYGTFTIYLVTSPDLEAAVGRLLADPHTGQVGKPDAAGIHWEKGNTAYGDAYWRAKRRYGSNLVLWWVGRSPVKKTESSFTTLHRALLSIQKR